MKEFPVYRIDNFEDYNQCQHCGNSFYIREFGKHIQEHNFLDKPHGHDFYILLLITKGSGIHNIDFKTYDVKTGAMFFIKPGQVHNWELSKDIDGYIIFFTKEYLLTEFHFNQLQRLPFFYTRVHEPVMMLDEDSVNTICATFSNIDNEYLGKGKFYHDIIKLNLKILLLEIERRYEDNSTVEGVSKYQNNQFYRFEQLVEENFKDHKTVSEYAEMMSLSVKQLNGVCKKVLGRTPGDIIQERIILEAKRLLIHSDYPVFSISETLNYTDNSYFIRLFKKATSMTPEQFRSRVTLHNVA
ncbi:AraC family transcriptional regulator [Cytophagaceae bacterium ABcell3]|nr:AraC family transcriptional regulator [Cytophagaceae bacterium ABcell3]